MNPTDPLRVQHDGMGGMRLEPTYRGDGSLASVEVVATPDEVTYGRAAGAWGKTPPRIVEMPGPIEASGKSQYAGLAIAHHDMAAAELRVLARMSELPPDMAGGVVRILPVPAAEYVAFAAAATPSFAPANGDTWPQFRRRAQVTVAAKNGGMTDAEAKELGQWDRDNAPDPATLKAHFVAVIRARCIVPSGRVAKRYRARGRW